MIAELCEAHFLVERQCPPVPFPHPQPHRLVSGRPCPVEAIVHQLVALSLTHLTLQQINTLNFDGVAPVRLRQLARGGVSAEFGVSNGRLIVGFEQKKPRLRVGQFSFENWLRNGRRDVFVHEFGRVVGRAKGFAHGGGREVSEPGRVGNGGGSDGQQFTAYFLRFQQIFNKSLRQPISNLL